jgi:lipopolysaccharide/colanic/teichoic acid biosynthesis glycosyltransferase
MKRLFDIVVSSAGLIAVAPLLCVVAGLVKLSSPGPVLFRQERIGRGFRPFAILKFRTMVQDAPAKGMAITVGGDPRITPIGHWLRKWKVDELPQLWNVLCGDMSLVGPRPEVRKYVEMFSGDYADVLTVRPGITDLASVRFRHESELLAQAQDPELEYCQRVLPQKIALAKEYIQRASVPFDLIVIAQTLIAILPAKSRTAVPAVEHERVTSLAGSRSASRSGSRSALRSVCPSPPSPLSPKRGEGEP